MIAKTEYFPCKATTKETFVRSVYSKYDDKKKKLDFDSVLHRIETEKSAVNKFVSSN